MDSIQEKLEYSLISILIAISLLFIVYMIALHSFGFNLTPVAYAEIISALATLLVVILTLGLRLIDDTLKRYETFAKPKLGNINSLLGGNSGLNVSVKSDLENYNMSLTLQSTIQNLNDSASALKKHGQFLFTKLYPKQSVTKTLEICGELQSLLTLIDEVKPYWATPSYFDLFLMSIVLRRIDPTKVVVGVYEKEFSNITERAKEISLKVESEKPTVVSQIRILREKILQEIENITKGLDDFLEAN